MDSFETHRARLLSLAYRVLGSFAEAEDVVQEAHLRWLSREPAPLESDRAWLERVVMNLCLDQLKSARARRESYVGTWLPEPVMTDSAQLSGTALDVEAISLAFLTLLERLSPLERAVYVLAEAFDYSHAELARALGRDEAAIRQLLHRAREHVKRGRPRFAPDKVAHEAMLGRFFGAVLQGDVHGVEELLAEQVVARSDGGGKVRAAINEVSGSNKVARLLIGIAKKGSPAAHYELRDVNGWPSLVGLEGERVISVTQLETDGQLVYGVSVVVNPEKLAHVTAAVPASS
jgi:RNA polymerase sigma-70 factor (ECF subfamily)